MKKRQITFWKNTGHPALRGKTVELFKVSWAGDSETDGEVPGWVRDDENGPYWGMYKLDTQEVRRLNRDPNDMGDVTYIDETPMEIVDPLLIEDLEAALEPPLSDETVHLEAEDVTVTPEGLDLGEAE